MNERTAQDQNPTTQKKHLSRRTFLRLATLFGIGTALGTETGCATPPPPKPEIVPQTEAEKQMDPTIQVFKRFLPHPYEAYDNQFAVLTRGALNDNVQPQEVTDLTNAVGKQFDGPLGQKLNIYPREAQMMAAAAFVLENGTTEPDELIALHMAIKGELKTSDGPFATMLAVVAMAQDRNVGNVIESYRLIAENVTGSKNRFGDVEDPTNSATRAILTGLLVRGQEIKDIDTWYKTFLADNTNTYEPETSANLALATYFAKGDSKKVKEIYDKSKEVFKTSVGNSIENYRTAFTLACMMNNGDYEKTLEMYMYAKKHEYTSQISCMLTLDTIAHEKGIPLVLGIITKPTKVGSDVRDLIVPLLLTPSAQPTE